MIPCIFVIFIKPIPIGIHYMKWIRNSTLTFCQHIMKIIITSIQ